MSEDSFTSERQSAHAEARGLYRMLGHDGNTIKELRELIAVPPETERALRAFARAHAEDSPWIEASLNFRLDVAREFERMMREGITETDLPELEESELGADEQTYANSQP